MYNSFLRPPFCPDASLPAKGAGGAVAANVARLRGMPALLGGYAFHGVGFLISFLNSILSADAAFFLIFVSPRM